MKIKRPALRYHGGKWRLAPWVISHFPEHERYVEPFCGAASVLMRKRRSKIEVINDLSGAIINFFRVLQDSAKAEQLREKLMVTPFSRDEYEHACTGLTGEDIEDARRVVIRSFMGYYSLQV